MSDEAHGLACEIPATPAKSPESGKARGEVRCIAACDLGGTKALIGLVDETGQILIQDRFLWPGQREPGQMVTLLASRLDQLITRAGLVWENILGVGCSIAAVLDTERSLIQFAPNLIGSAQNVPFKALLQAALPQCCRRQELQPQCCQQQELQPWPVWLEMDARASALGEAWQGAGAGASELVYVVVGTGIGAGLLFHGQIYRGWGGMAGEFGHTTIEPGGPRCNCGNYGCLEVLASGPAIAQQAQMALRQGRASVMHELAAQEGLSAEMVMHAARLGDEVACDIIRQAAEYIGIGLANLLNLLNPQVIVLGGGVIQGGADLMLEPIRLAAARRCGSWIEGRSSGDDRRASSRSRIVVARLGEAAGLLGAARLGWMAEKLEI